MRKSKLKQKYGVKHAPTLYHLSIDNLNGQTLKPRVPHSTVMDFGNGEAYEDECSKRVCFSSSMSGCLRALEFERCDIEYYVHILDNKDELLRNGDIINPTTELVYDRDYTNEYWVVGKCKLKCIGKARFNYEPNVMYYQKEFRPHVNIRWIEKY